MFGPVASYLVEAEDVNKMLVFQTAGGTLAVTEHDLAAEGAVAI
jgi:hypothetical protein